MDVNKAHCVKRESVIGMSESVPQNEQMVYESVNTSKSHKKFAQKTTNGAQFEILDSQSSNVNKNNTDDSAIIINSDIEDAVTFDWDDYLMSTLSVAAPHRCFRHVEVSLFNGFSPGMKLEIANKENSNTYWVATLISTCGSLLLLRFDGSGDDRKYDFWADLSSADLHPIGWCAQTGKTLQPPEHIRDRHEDWVNFLVEDLVGARSAPARFLEGPNKGKAVTEMIECGMILEVQDSQHPQHVWVVEVINNVGGRLLLRYKGLRKNDSDYDFWLFFLDPRLHHFGWGKSCGLTMRPPDAISNKCATKEEWARVLTVSLLGIDESGLVPECVFKDQAIFKHHNVKESWKLAMLDPMNRNKIRPATVVRVINDYFFLAEIDGMRKHSPNCAMLCHSSSPGIFSVDWCIKHVIATEPLHGDGSTFSWIQYLEYGSSVAAPSSCFPHCDSEHDFEVGMKMEACNPSNLHEIAVATVLQICGGILLLELDSGKVEKMRCYYQASSMDIFPVGWCQSNDYILSAPRYISRNNVDNNETEDCEEMVVDASYETELNDDVQAIREVINPSSDSKLWCPVLCFNCICKSGPFLNDCDLSRIPKCVGPGNTVLVLKEVLTLLVKAAERPHKLLKDLEDFTLCNWSYPCIIKTKFGGKKYQGTLHIVDTAANVPEFVTTLLEFLRCCPHLITVGEPITECNLDCVRPVGRPAQKKISGKKTFDKHNGVSGARERSHIFNDEQTARKTNPAIVAGNPGSCEKRRPNKLMQANLTWSCSSPSTIQKVYENLNRRNRSRRIHKLYLHSNPLHWTTEEVVEFFESTECAKYAPYFANQHVDGQALLLLTLPVIEQFLGLKLGSALKVARQVERVKIAFYEKFCN